MTAVVLIRFLFFVFFTKMRYGSVRTGRHFVSQTSGFDQDENYQIYQQNTNLPTLRTILGAGSRFDSWNTHCG